MTKVRFVLRSQKENATIYARFQNGRNNSFIKKTLLYVEDPKQWDAKNDCISTRSSAPDKDIVNPALANLNGYILNAHRTDVLNGVEINDQWLVDTILKQAGQFKDKKDELELFSVFAKEWIARNGGSRITSSTRKQASKMTIDMFIVTINMVSDFDTYRGKPTKFDDIDLAWFYEFLKFMDEVKGYAYRTKKTYVSKLSTLLTEAKTEFGRKVNEQYKSKKFFVPKDEGRKIDGLYLNTDQLNTLMDLKITKELLGKTKLHYELLSSARDWLVIACWTGLRFQDLMNLTPDLLQNGRWIIPTTIKTDTPVDIPIDVHIEEIMEKWGGQLPPVVNDINIFNVRIRKVCELAGFDKPTKGEIPTATLDKLTGKMTSRNVYAEYPFYKLVTSHIGRKSMGTNLRETLSRDVVMDLMGHSSKEISEYYNKEKRVASADKAEVFFDARRNNWKNRENNNSDNSAE